MMGVDLCVGSPGPACTALRERREELRWTEQQQVWTLYIYQLGLHGGQINGPDPGDHLQLCSPDQKLNTFITNDPRCRDMGSGQPKCKTHPEMCLVIDNTPKLLVVSISTGILLPDLQTALLCSHLPTKCCKKSLGSGMRRDERETVSANSKQCSRMNYPEHKPGQNIHLKW